MRETTSSRRRAARSRPRLGWLWTPIALLALGALVVAATPYALRFGLERWLLAHGATQVGVGELRANPVTGAIQIHELDVRNADGRMLRAATVRTRFLWRGLLERRTAFDTLAVHDADILLGPATRRLLATAPDADWPLSFQRITLSDVELHLPALQDSATLRISQGTLAPWGHTDTPTRVALTGTFNGAALRLRGNINLDNGAVRGDGQLEIDDFALSHFTPSDSRADAWQGRVSVNLRLESQPDADRGPQISHEGTIRIQELRAHGSDAQVQSAHGVWAGNGVVQLRKDTLHFQQQGQLTAAQLRIETPSGAYGVDNLEWHGQMTATAGARTAIAISADGTLQTQALAYRPAQSRIAVDARRTHWQGVISHGIFDVPGGLSAQGQLEVADLQLRRDQRPQVLLSAARTELRDVDVKGTYAVAAQTLELWNYRGLAAPEADGRAVLQGAQAHFDAVTITGRQRFEAQRLELHSATLLLHRQEDGHWFGLTAAGSDPDPGGVRNDSWRIERIEIAGDANSIRYEDHSVQPPFNRSLQLQRLTLGELDSDAPRQPSPIALQAAIADGTRIVAVGKLRPFADQRNLALKTKISRLPLAPLSPYSEQHIGYRIGAGAAQIESNLHIIDNQLRTDNVLLVRGLQLQGPTGSGSRSWRDSLGMPAMAAVGVLQDKDRRLRVPVPLRGDLDDQNFRLGVAFDRALGDALRSAALATANRNLHPFDIAEVTPDTGLRLEPLRFRADSAELNQVARTYLRRVAGLLQQRPALRLRVCGVVTAAEGTASQALAERRTEVIVQALQENGDVDPARLLTCPSRAEADAQGQPRSELLLL